MNWDKLMRESYTDREKDEVTDMYLRTNDPYYLDTSSNKINKLEYPYHTVTQSKRVIDTEVPESSLNVEGTIEAKKKGIAENKII